MEAKSQSHSHAGVNENCVSFCRCMADLALETSSVSRSPLRQARGAHSGSHGRNQCWHRGHAHLVSFYGSTRLNRGRGWGGEEFVQMWESQAWMPAPSVPFTQFYLFIYLCFHLLSFITLASLGIVGIVCITPIVAFQNLFFVGWCWQTAADSVLHG